MKTEIATHTTPLNNIQTLYFIADGEYEISHSGTPHSGLYSRSPEVERVSWREAAFFAYKNLDTEKSCNIFPEIRLAVTRANQTATLDNDHTVWCVLWGYDVDSHGQIIAVTDK